MATKIESCPFCGAHQIPLKDSEEIWTDEDCQSACWHCPNCKASGPSIEVVDQDEGLDVDFVATVEAAIGAWNIRLSFKEA